MLRSSISSPSLQSFILKATMSSSRFNVRGRGRWHRGFCDRPPFGGSGGDHPFVSGDSHLDAVRDSNYGYRRGYGGNYSIPRGSPGQDFPPRQQSYPHPQFRPNPQSPHFRPQHPHRHLAEFRPNPQPQFRPRSQQRPEDHRNWVYTVNQPPPQCERFTVLSYNILADYLARDHRSKLYFHIPHYILDWEWRKKRLLLEFGLWSPDIMCLQEVDKFHDLEEELSIRGYDGIWQMRTGKAVDGCALFWRTNRFWLRHEEHIEFNKLGLRDNVAQICVLESKNKIPAENPSTSFHESPDQSEEVNQIVICNIHVLYNPKRGEMKLGQVRLLLDRAHAVSRTWNNAPVVVCGDFNCTPKSPLYNFISEQKLSLSGLTRNQISGQHAASVYAEPPYFGPAYRPQHSRENYTGPKDVGQDNNHHMLQNEIENISQKDRLPSPKFSMGVSTGKSLSDFSDSVAKEIDEVDLLGSCSGDVISSLTSQQRDESCETRGEIPLHTRNCGNQDVTSVVYSNNEPSSGEFELKHGGDGSIHQTILSTQSRSDACRSQPNEGILDELRHDLDSTSGSQRSRELRYLSHGEKDLLKFEAEFSFAPITHDVLTDDISNDNTNANRDLPVEDSQSDVSSEKILPDESKPQNNVGTSVLSFELSSGTMAGNDKMSTIEKIDAFSVLTIEDKVGTDSSFEHVANEVNPSIFNSSINGIDRARLKDLLSDGVCGSTEENISPDRVDHNECIDSNSEESNQFSGKSALISAYDGKLLKDQGDFSEVDTLTNEMCSSEENSDPNFFKELVGREDSRDYVELYGEDNISFSPGHTLENAESNGIAFDLADSPTEGIQDNTLHQAASHSCNWEYSYNPYLWTPMEIELASGNTDCSLIEHQLKMRSAYTDVEDYAGTKDSSREPEVTSYHRLFMGTVDYIWYSEGLQTVRVLDTIPKRVLQKTAGFPTKKWGSDHLALVCELAFTNGVETPK